MNLVSSILGSLLCLTGIIGLFSNQFMGMALNPTHDILLLVLGVTGLYFGARGTEFEARTACRSLGILFLLFGVATLMSHPGLLQPEGLYMQTQNAYILVPRFLEFSSADGIRDLIFGLIGAIAGFIPREQEIRIDMQAQKARQKIGGRS